MSDATVEIHDYNPGWPALFAVECQKIREALGYWLIGPIEHIGSTAVPGLSAKPVIDIMAPVSTLEASFDAIAAAKVIDFMYFAYKPESMHWFCKPSPAQRTHHLHLVPLLSQTWRDRLAFRTALHTSATLRTDYQNLKLSLALLHRNDRDAYTEAKSSFINNALKQVCIP